MKTLADLKRALQPKVKLIQTFREETFVDINGNRTLASVAIPKKLQGIRTITHADTTGVYLSQTPEDGHKGSFLGFPKAKDLIFEAPDSTFTVIGRTNDGEIWLKMTYQIIN